MKNIFTKNNNSILIRSINNDSWPSGSNYDENRQLLGTEEESSDRQSSDEEVRGRELSAGKRYKV